MPWNALKTVRNAIHPSNVYRCHLRWSKDGSYERLFTVSIMRLKETEQLDLGVLRGDGSDAIAKKEGEDLGYSGHKHQKGLKELTIVDNRGYIIAPPLTAPVNRHDSVLLPESVTAFYPSRKDFIFRS